MKRALPLLLPLLLAACGGLEGAKPTSDAVKPTAAFVNLPATVAQPGQLKVSVKAEDNVGVREVRFYVDDKLVDTDSGAPFESLLTLSAGNYTLKAIAVDTSGNESAPAVQTVRVGDGESPTLDLKGPTVVRTTAPVKFNIAASDNIGVSRVTVYEGDKELQTFTQFPAVLSRTFTIADNGQHTYRAVAWDAAGNQVTQLLTFTVDISNAPVDTQKPTVSIGEIPATITVAGTYPLSFSASDNVGIDRIEVQLTSTTALGTRTQPFPTIRASSGKVDLPVTRELNGKYELTVIAYDAAGNSSQTYSQFTVAIP